MNVSPIRVLHVFGTLNCGGAESRTMDIYRNINREKVQFDFVVHTKDIGSFEEEIHQLGGRVYHSIPRFKIYNTRQYNNKWETFLKDNVYQIIHIHTINSAGIILDVAKKLGIPIRICHARSSNSSFLKQLYVRANKSKISNKSTNRFAVSKLAGGFAFNNDFKIIPNAIDSSLYKFNEQTRKIYRKNNGFSNEIIVGHVGRFEKVKNHKFLLRIMKALIIQNPMYRLVLVGHGSQDEAIKKQISKWQLGKYVTIVGKRDDVSDMMQMFDIFLLPSHYEGFPGVSIEAQSAGLPIVMSDTITTEAGIIDGTYAFLPIQNNENEWVNEIFKLVKKYPPGTAIRYSAYEKIEESGYDIKTVSRWYENFYINA